MASFVPSTIGLTQELVGLLEVISRKQGELSAHQHRVQDELTIESIASVDAVHYSTKIEGNSLTRDQVTQALDLGKLRAPARELNEVLNYARTRRLVNEWTLKGKPMNDAWVLTHHSEVLKGIVRGRLLGHYREALCVIKDSKSHAITYMAPDWKDVPELMKGLLSWTRQSKVSGSSALLRAAQFHFEFVTIHPFMDGNGRLARLLTNGLLLSGGYGVGQYAALEKQHEATRAEYYRSLRNLQAGNYYNISPGQDIQTWVAYWLRCLSATYDEALARVAGTKAPRESDHPLKMEDRLERAIALFRRHQKLRAGEYADLAGVGRTQAVADLNVLVLSNILEKVGGGRSTVYRIKSAKI